jgi:hypothetical protein
MFTCQLDNNKSVKIIFHLYYIIYVREQIWYLIVHTDLH